MSRNYEELFTDMVKAAESGESIEMTDEEAVLLIAKLTGVITRMKEKTDVFERALKFYADQNNYTQGILKQAVLLDGGRTAERALEDIK